jgi:hypothetical protein
LLLVSVVFCFHEDPLWLSLTFSLFSYAIPNTRFEVMGLHEGVDTMVAFIQA